METRLTPVERRGRYWFKRDDLYERYGVRGGKVRTCVALAAGAAGLVSAGSRQSPQLAYAAAVAEGMGIPCKLFTPTGEDTPEICYAASKGAEVYRVRPGYNNVLASRAKALARALGYALAPFGMECEEAVRQTAQQVRNIPEGVRRIVMPVGSGMSLAGVLTGLVLADCPLPVLGVCVGADAQKRLTKYGPPGTRRNLTLEFAAGEYHSAAAQTEIEGVELDPLYEAKCIPYLKEDDLLWVVGVRPTL